MEEQKDALNRAIAALRSGRTREGSKRTSSGRGKARHMSVAARRKISLAMKKNWEERRKTT